MADDSKKPAAKRLGGLNNGPGAGRLGGLKSGDGAGPSSAATGAAGTSGAASGARKMRFMPTNFARPKQRADSTSEGAPSTSVSVASKSESAFSDLVKAAKAEATWQKGGRGRGAGRGTGRVLTTFGGGAGVVPGGSGPTGGRRVWGGSGGAGVAGRGAGGGTRRLVKAGDVKAEPGTAGDADEDGKLLGSIQEIEEDLEEEEFDEDPLSYDQFYPVMLPHREPGEPLPRDPDDPTKVIPKDLFDLPEDYRPMLDELSFLQDVEQNDGRLMLFQLPTLLPIAAMVPDPAAGATAAAGGAPKLVATSRPASLREVPTSRIGKLLVFESGKVKMQIGDVLLDVDPGIPPRFRQDVAVISAQSKQCVMLAPVSLRMVCTPNVDTLLDPEQPLPDWERRAAAAAAAAAGPVASDKAGASGGAAAAAAAVGKRQVVLDESEDEEVEEAGEGAVPMDGVEAAAATPAAAGAPAAAAAANGAQQQQQQQQQQRVQQQGKQQQQKQQVRVKEEDEEEVQSPRRGGLRSPRAGRRAAGGGGGGGGAT